LKELHHPNIVKYLHHYESDGYLFIVMEYVEEGDLTKLIDQYKIEDKLIPEDLIWNIIAQLVSALKYSHYQKIIHRDIKSANIFFSSGVVKLADFGLSKHVPKENYEFENFNPAEGSLFYLSPEEAEGNSYSFPIDIWNH
jgi:NIMA (never in mitosis gene a)-related kinase